MITTNKIIIARDEDDHMSACVYSYENLVNALRQVLLFNKRTTVFYHGQDEDLRELLEKNSGEPELLEFVDQYTADRRNNHLLSVLEVQYEIPESLFY